MKNKRKHLFTAAAGVLLIIAVCCGIFYFVDNVLNGAFVNWVENKFIYIRNVDVSGTDGDFYSTQVDWYGVKFFILKVMIISMVLWILSIMAVSRLYANVKVKKSITFTSRMIQEYMNGEREAFGMFPKEYAEISAQMTEIKAAMQRHEQILKEEAARKNDLIAYLAHDLKTPLTSVIGYLSLLDEVQDMPQEQKEKYTHITLDKALRLEGLINEFFEITRYNLQQIDLEKETIDLYYMLVQMTDEFYPILQRHDNKTELNLDENMMIYGDAMKLARVFNNLLKNAIAYSYPGTTISIYGEETEDGCKISFCNTGKTIPKTKLESIFEKFFRLDEARATNSGGAGLGLAIAKEIITLHGGTITAQSENEHTTFSIILPDKGL